MDGSERSVDIEIYVMIVSFAHIIVQGTLVLSCICGGSGRIASCTTETGADGAGFSYVRNLSFYGGICMKGGIAGHHVMLHWICVYRFAEPRNGRIIIPSGSGIHHFEC
jgi:hypothetical protein